MSVATIFLELLVVAGLCNWHAAELRCIRETANSNDERPEGYTALSLAYPCDADVQTKFISIMSQPRFLVAPVGLFDNTAGTSTIWLLVIFFGVMVGLLVRQVALLPTALKLVQLGSRVAISAWILGNTLATLNSAVPKIAFNHLPVSGSSVAVPFLVWKAVIAARLPFRHQAIVGLLEWTVCIAALLAEAAAGVRLPVSPSEVVGLFVVVYVVPALAVFYQDAPGKNAAASIPQPREAEVASQSTLNERLQPAAPVSVQEYASALPPRRQGQTQLQIRKLLEIAAARDKTSARVPYTRQSSRCMMSLKVEYDHSIQFQDAANKLLSAYGEAITKYNASHEVQLQSYSAVAVQGCVQLFINMYLPRSLCQLLSFTAELLEPTAPAPAPTSPPVVHDELDLQPVGPAKSPPLDLDSVHAKIASMLDVAVSRSTGAICPSHQAAPLAYEHNTFLAPAVIATWEAQDGRVDSLMFPGAYQELQLTIVDVDPADIDPDYQLVVAQGRDVLFHVTVQAVVDRNSAILRFTVPSPGQLGGVQVHVMRSASRAGAEAGHRPLASLLLLALQKPAADELSHLQQQLTLEYHQDYPQAPAQALASSDGLGASDGSLASTGGDSLAGDSDVELLCSLRAYQQLVPLLEDLAAVLSPSELRPANWHDLAEPLLLYLLGRSMWQCIASVLLALEDGEVQLLLDGLDLSAGQAWEIMSHSASGNAPPSHLLLPSECTMITPEPVAVPVHVPLQTWPELRGLDPFPVLPGPFQGVFSTGAPDAEVVSSACTCSTASANSCGGCTGAGLCPACAAAGRCSSALSLRGCRAGSARLAALLGMGSARAEFSKFKARHWPFVAVTMRLALALHVSLLVHSLLRLVPAWEPLALPLGISVLLAALAGVGPKPAVPSSLQASLWCSMHAVRELVELHVGTVWWEAAGGNPWPDHVIPARACAVRMVLSMAAAVAAWALAAREGFSYGLGTTGELLLGTMVVLPHAMYAPWCSKPAGVALCFVGSYAATAVARGLWLAGLHLTFACRRRPLGC